jgi:hypothetical protein
VDPERLGDVLRRGLRLEYERSPDRDVGYSLRKVMDVAALHHGSGHPAVLRRTTTLLREVGRRSRGRGFDGDLRQRLRQLADVAGESTCIPAEERERWAERLEAALAGRWPADHPGGGTGASPEALQGRTAR